MDLSQLAKKAQEEFAGISNLLVEGVVGITKKEEGWVISLEVLERRAIPDTMDILGLYEVYLDPEGNLNGYERKRLRKRGDTEEEKY